MSDFRCNQGHIIYPSDGFCQLCRAAGLPGRIYSMDGISNNEGLQGDLDLNYEDDAWEIFEDKEEYGE